jgi:hypothetical protein
MYAFVHPNQFEKLRPDEFCDLVALEPVLLLQGESDVSDSIALKALVTASHPAQPTDPPELQPAPHIEIRLPMV